jgi:hypothetical protein
MSNRKFFKVIQRFFSDMGKSFRAIPPSFVNWLLRIALMTQRRSRRSTAGFILPTTILLILVVSLTVGALTYRAFTRNTQVIGENQQRVIYNAATPTIDRARSKLEFLFDPSKDTRYPGGVPSEPRLLAMLLNDGSNNLAALAVNGADPYTLPDERRVNIGGTAAVDNAWSYRTDTNGDGQTDATVIYSILLKAPDPTATETTPQRLIRLSENEKAADLYVRHGPLSQEDSSIRCTSQAGRTTTEDGWFADSGGSAVLRKNFQVDAMVLPDNVNGTATTLEFNQDRQLDRGNKWGAWFRNDLEIFPGSQFNWNGAMHTEGSLILGDSGNNKTLNLYLISSPNSCLFYESASEISVTQKNPAAPATEPNFLGHVFAGLVGDNRTIASNVEIHVQNGRTQDTTPRLTSANQSTPQPLPSEIIADPTAIVVNDGYKSRGADTTNRAGSRWQANNTMEVIGGVDFKNRLISRSQVAPYVDDLYRADDRWGPKPRYKPGSNPGDSVQAPDKIGDRIADSTISTAQKDALIAAVPSTGAGDAAVGLDGYWERRARNEGLRLIVGQRLELGNLNTWITPRDINNDGYIQPATGAITPTESAQEREGDPLYPPTVRPYPTPNSSARISHLDTQRRTLRDNLAAVQSTAVYHTASGSKDYPVACFASTTHPGTPTTLQQSINFFPTQFRNQAGNTYLPLVTDFFTGRGTNGWEFEPPGGTEASFIGQLGAGQPLRIALNNLANFAGDPEGAYPFDLSISQGGSGSGGRIRPYPALTMWGNYSNLRRALERLDISGYNALSIADKTYLHTAACTVGMLAYEIDTIQKFDPTNRLNETLPGSGNQRVLSGLALDLYNLMDGRVNNGEVLPTAQLSTYSYDPGVSGNLSGPYNPRDYDNVPPEVFIGKLRESYVGSNQPLNAAKLRMAELIMLSQQIRRDRTYGFRSSPTFGEYLVEIPGLGTHAFPTACDPDQFKLQAGGGSLLPLTPSPSGAAAASNDDLARFRLGLSRLCGALNTETYRTATPLVNNTGAFTTAPGNAAKEAQMPMVLPKFPSLYYLFPEVDHGVVGAVDTTIPGYDHRQPGSFNPATATPAAPELNSNDREPYVVDTYIQTAPKLGTGAAFQRVMTTPPTTAYLSARALPTENTLVRTNIPIANANYPNVTRATVYQVPDYPVSAVAVAPRSADLTTWRLPTGRVADNVSSTGISGGSNVATNYIMVPTGDEPTNTEARSVPFLDRAFFDGRQLMTVRTMDVDLGMLRKNTKSLTGNVWLPTSGIVYAFREDAVREDAIMRPAGGTQSNMTNPAQPTDPDVTPSSTNRGIALKSIDYTPDPERRPYGFRLRNGSQIKRQSGLIPDKDNNRGLSFFTDQPVYIQGDFNLHQNGADDTAGARLEEFTQLLPTNYNQTEFYGRITGDPRFANSDPAITDVALKDRWRPSEILADSVTILSKNFCDGSIQETFVLTNRSNANPLFSALPNIPGSDEVGRSVYGGAEAAPSAQGLFGPGCVGNGYTSFHNQNRPRTELPNSNAARAEWVREVGSNATLPQRLPTYPNSYWPDFTSPFKIDRRGNPLVVASRTTANPIATGQSLPRPTIYDTSVSPANSTDRANYCPIGGTFNQGTGDCRRLMDAVPTRVNSIIVSGIPPSQRNQSYGGLHNFPRFLERWINNTVSISGSFLQLSFDNYSTAPYELEAWEPGHTTSTDANIRYYVPPTRSWGYDVGLQFSPAGPAAARFVTASSTRNEFYIEPPVNDPYMNKLCQAVKASPHPGTPAGVTARINCPT